jgi:hypothetical protein
MNRIDRMGMEKTAAVRARDAVAGLQETCPSCLLIRILFGQAGPETVQGTFSGPASNVVALVALLFKVLLFLLIEWEFREGRLFYGLNFTRKSIEEIKFSSIRS